MEIQNGTHVKDKNNNGDGSRARFYCEYTSAKCQGASSSFSKGGTRFSFTIKRLVSHYSKKEMEHQELGDFSSFIFGNPDTKNCL